MLTILQDKLLSFQGSVLGFNEYDGYRLTVVDDEGMYGFLQSEDNEHVGFLVVNPFTRYADYSLELEDSVMETLGLRSHEEVAVLVIVTIQEPFDKSTVNLLAPLVLNVSNGKGRQIVLSPKSNYGTKEPLLHPVQIEGEV